MKKKILTILGLIILFISVSAGSSEAIRSEGGPHLWLSTDPAQFDEGGVGYMGDVGDPWFNDSYFTMDKPFDLYIYNAHRNGVTATDIQLLVAVQSGEAGTVSVGGSNYTVFTGTTLPPEYGSGSHGIYDDPEGSHNGRYAIVPLGFDLIPLEFRKINISYEGFPIIHLDVISSNGYWNPPSHDVTADPPTIPEPSTIILLGCGLLGLGVFRKKFKQ